jgi:hypothetical protein
MIKTFSLCALFLMAFMCISFGQGAADRATSRTDTTRAKTDGRFNRLNENQLGNEQETIVKEQVITVPVGKGASPARRSQGQNMITTQEFIAPKAGNQPQETIPDVTKPRTKRIVVRRVETVKKPAPLKINPY